jgi:hypothetical protein
VSCLPDIKGRRIAVPQCKNHYECGKSSSVKKLMLVIGASLREQMRWAAEHLYTLLILTPLVAGISYATVSRLTSEAPEWHLSFRVSLAGCAGLVISLIGLSLTRATSEIFHLRKPESFLEALPVSHSTQLHAAILKRLARTFVVALFVFVLRALTGVEKATESQVLVPLVLFVLTISLAEAMAALSWIHWGHRRNWPAAVTALLAVVLSSIFAGLFLTKIFSPDIVPEGVGSLMSPLGVVWVFALFLATRALHARWRSSDIEYAKRLQAGGRVNVFGLRFLRKNFTSDIALSIARDFQLTLRGFSSAVYVALFIFVLLLLVLGTVLATGWLPPVAAAPSWFNATWLPSVMATKVVCVLATASCSNLVAVLVTYQLPFFWLERAAGTTGKQMWKTKLWYTRLVSIASPLLAWMIAILSGMVPLYYVLPLLLECVWLWWIVSTLIGALAFEIPERPELAIVLMISFGAVVGLLITVFWPIGLVLFALNGIRGLTLRGHSRARFCLITEGD